MLPADATEKFFYIPAWVKVVVIALVLALLFMSGFLLYMAIKLPDVEQWVIAAVSVAELGGATLLAALVMFYVERGRRVPRVEQLSKAFFLQEVPAALKKLSHNSPPFREWQGAEDDYEDLVSTVGVSVSYAEGSYHADYIVRDDDVVIALYIEMNVKRLGIVYKTDRLEDTDVETFFAAFRDTWEGARDAGYHIGIARDVSDTHADLRRANGWTGCYAQPLHLNKDDNFLYDEVERQFIAQDICIMTKSFIGEGRLERRFGSRAGEPPEPLEAR